MPFIKVYIHFVWTTKCRQPMLQNPSHRVIMHQHIRENALKKDIFIDHLAVQEEHCHCLVSLGKEQTMSKVMQLIKGESSFWFNQQKFMRLKLDWQDEYFANSVSESVLPRVRAYIRNQDSHHKKRNFEEEYKQLLEHFEKING
jgi:putative transposase